MAQEGNHHERVKAIHQLAQIKHLKDWDFRHLAQICDARTATALANSDCDQRWFLLPLKYGLHKPIDEILQSIKTLLEQLVPNKCVEYILKTTFSHQDDKVHKFVLLIFIRVQI
jgi:protein SERAC1